MKIKRSTLTMLRRVWIISLTIFVLGGTFYLYFLTPLFTITSYTVVGIPTSYVEEVERSLALLREERVYRIIPADKILTYKSTFIRSAILKHIPNAKEITIYPENINTLRIEVALHTPVFRLSDMQGVTKEGVVYTEIQSLETLPLLVLATGSTKEVVYDSITHVHLEILNVKTIHALLELIANVEDTLFLHKKGTRAKHAFV